MILFKLRCSAGHEFEAWFRDGATYERQASRGLIACLDCGDTSVAKAPMAPRVAKAAAAAEAPPDAAPEQLRHMLQILRRHVEAHCDHVGDRFAEEVRRIERGEAEKRGIYGDATEAEARALAEEGIEVARIPWLPRNDA
jgi:hypothetical protein